MKRQKKKSCVKRIDIEKRIFLILIDEMSRWGGEPTMSDILVAIISAEKISKII